MTNRSEEPLMHHVRDQFASWEPQAPAGVQQAVYAELGKGAFWRWSWTSLNVWYLAVLLAGAGLWMGATLTTDTEFTASTLEAPSNQTVTWEAFYPTQPAPAACSTLHDVTIAAADEAPQNVWAPVQNATAAAPLLTAAIEGEMLDPRGPQLLQGASLVPQLFTTGNYYGKVDIWSQLQDADRDELRLVFDVTVDGEQE